MSKSNGNGDRGSGDGSSSGDVWKRWMASRDALPTSPPPIPAPPSTRKAVVAQTVAATHNLPVQRGVPHDHRPEDDAETPFFTVDEESDPIDLAPIVGAPRRPVEPRPVIPHTPTDIDPLPLGDFAAAELPSYRVMPPVAPREAWWRRSLWTGIALVLTAAYFYFALFSFWAPAPTRPGIDENVYLVAGKNIAQHGTVGFHPSDDYQFISAMWIRTAEETKPLGVGPKWFRDKFAAHTKEDWYYPKYPFGQPLLHAVGYWVGNATGFHGRDLAFLVNPFLASLALLGMYFIGRAVAGGFFGVLAMLILGTGQVALELAIVPSSHASDLCFVVWGVYLLLRWWQTGSIWRGFVGGFLLGFAVTIRYSEAQLLFPFFPLDQVLADTAWWKDKDHYVWARHLVGVVKLLPVGPLGIACICAMRWSRVTSYLRSAVPLIGWAIPVASLVTYNWFTIGHASGYDVTNESTGFTTTEFLSKWDFAVQQMYLFGLFPILPLGIAGMALIYRRSWRMGLLLTSWFVPGALLYVAYYWGRNMPGVYYLRFFLSLFPPVIAAAVWLMASAGRGAMRPITAGDWWHRWWQRGSIAVPLGAGVLAAAACGVGLWSAVPHLERQHRGNMNLAYSVQQYRVATKPILAETTRRLRRNETPLPPVVFADEGLFPVLLMHLQYSTDGDFYATDTFFPRIAGGFGMMGLVGNAKSDADRDSPVLLQKQRIEYMSKVLKGKTAADMIKDQHQIVDDAIANKRCVFGIVTPVQEADFRKHFKDEPYEVKELTRWDEPCKIPEQDMRKQTPLAPVDHFGEPMIRWRPQTLILLQVTRRDVAPTTQPTTQPTHEVRKAPETAMR